ncbi:zinc ribbon domain-containing protein [Halorubrum sp. 48-1-W]|uniref:DUF7560 family zinc ribbon protein n=1 Tax=Halorubrum sp. 48-1-W TaxID=2249761 RepID=UPI000DCD8644|nr:zinc ribbon domain-containing protein [Halorubrum sp. 48-1-W]RAW45086.1 zinc ribbon domain-containing protein [Halorubrum sp. 48-1-W]
MTTEEFSCPGCDQTIEVNDEMRETILEVGCPVCTAVVSPDDFVQISSGSSS